MIVNITPNNFGGRLRNGDIVAALNFCESVRIKNPEVKFYLPHDSVSPTDYCFKFRDWITEKVDILTNTPGNNFLNVSGINLWDSRTITGDIFKIKNENIKKKICIFPLFDAPYNVYRNWSVEMLQSFIDHYMNDKYKDYEKYICINKQISNVDLKDFRYSHDFLENLNHLMECSHYVGGETGMSVLASVLDNNDRILNYYYSSVGLLHTIPLYVLEGKKGHLNLYTPNSWRTDYL